MELECLTAKENVCYAVTPCLNSTLAFENRKGNFKENFINKFFKFYHWNNVSDDRKQCFTCWEGAQGKKAKQPQLAVDGGLVHLYNFSLTLCCKCSN